MKILSTSILIILFFSANGQKKIMNQSAYAEWNTIKSEAISNDGEWVKYHLVPGKGDKTLKLYNTITKEYQSFPRVQQSRFTENSKYLVYKKSAAYDTIIYKRRRKVEKKDLPSDSLVIINLVSGSETVIPHIGTYKIPEKWNTAIAYQAKIAVDTSKTEMEQKFFVHNLISNHRDTIENVDEYSMAEEGEMIVFQRSGKDTSVLTGVFSYNPNKNLQEAIYQAPGKYKNIAIDKLGDKFSFIADLDTSDRRQRPYELYLYENGETKKLVGGFEKLKDSDYIITEHTKPYFSESGDNLYFGVGRKSIMADSLALEEEQVQVEVWHSEDPVLYTMQELQEDRLKSEAYKVRYDIQSGKMLPLETELIKDVKLSRKGDGEYYLTSNKNPYGKEVTWTGRTRADYYLGNLNNGQEKLWKTGLSASPNFSPGGNYLYWYDGEKEDWFIYDIKNDKEVNVTRGKSGFKDERNDRPMKARPYGSVGWTADDEAFILYSRYDIWKYNSVSGELTNLTNSRSSSISWRIIDLDKEEESVNDNAFTLLFNEQSKDSGYGKLNLQTGQKSVLEMKSLSFRRNPIKARDADKLVFSTESFKRFPDLLLSDMSLSNQEKFSNANPQQNAYRWGNIEIFKWKDFNGHEVEGLLVKPENFDPLQKYPVIVNFYERSSDGLHRHRAPEPHRSTINYSYYANKGYVIFNPDVKYKIGDPGESAYNAVVSGVEALSKNQFVNQERIGVQGHSWGGYQIAHLLNKTDVFKCAESGAPVVNMVSAYGGIRWGSGMSRMFQYEKTQSRLGATLWEDPDAYLRNSPIFEVNKMNTPVLILHNDNDGAVPWYQGIEYFMALRRLGKPAWLLNYNGEPHWPLKWDNRLDFNKRMEQFFGHYLKDEPMPLWMKQGVPVTNKGILQGFETEE